jgi:hypothetical protein
MPWFPLPLLAVARGGEETTVVEWTLPSEIYLAARVVLSLAYLYSACTKLASPSWIDGSALSRVLANPLARDTMLRTFLLSLPAWLLRMATWFALTLELGFAPLAMFRQLRPLVWVAMVGLQVSLLFVINFADLTAGMLIAHLFTFDPAWIQSRSASDQGLAPAVGGKTRALPSQ